MALIAGVDLVELRELGAVEVAGVPVGRRGGELGRGGVGRDRAGGGAVA